MMYDVPHIGLIGALMVQGSRSLFKPPNTRAAPLRVWGRLYPNPTFIDRAVHFLFQLLLTPLDHTREVQVSKLLRL